MSSEIDYKSRSKANGTGSASIADEFVRIVYPFEKYEIVVKLTPDRKFVGIEEVRVNKDFRSFKQKISEKQFSYIDEYRPE